MGKTEVGKMVLSLVLALAGMTRADTVLLSDNFNGITATTDDVSANLAGRQSGTLAPASYTASGWSWYLVPDEGVSGTSALQCTENGVSSCVSPDTNFFSGTTTSLPDGGFTITFTLKASVMSEGSTADVNALKTVGVAFGGDSAWSASPSANASSFAVTFDGNQWMHLYVGGNVVYSMGIEALTLGEYHTIQISYVGNSLGDGTAAKLLVAIDGQLIDLNNNNAMGKAYPFTMANYGDPSLNYLHLVTTGWACDFDNLEVRTGTLLKPWQMDLTRGYQILFEKGLQIQAQCFPQKEDHFWEPAYFTGLNLNRFFQANFTTVNMHSNYWQSYVLGNAPGVAWGRYAAPGTGAEVLVDSELPYLSNMVSFQYGDEMDVTDPNVVAGMKAWYAANRVRYPNVLSYDDQSPGDSVTSDQIKAYIVGAKPDMTMFNCYPFTGSLPGGSPTILYKYLQKYRLLGLAGLDGNGNQPIPSGVYTETWKAGGHTPSESELRLNEFAAWTFGYKFISAFTYDSSDSVRTFAPIMFDGIDDSSPTAEYYEVAEVNRQSKNLGPALVQLLSTDVRMVMGQNGGGATNAVPAGITTGVAGADTCLTGLSATNLGGKNNHLPGDVIVGFFKVLDESFDGDSYTNEKYFMITNGLSDAVGTAAETQQTIHITFNLPGNITSLQRLSRTTGQVEVVPLVSDGNGNYHLDLVLDGGTGDLFKYNTGAPFVGVTAGPTATTVHGTVTYTDVAGYPLNTVTIEIRSGTTVVETHSALALSGSTGNKTYTFTTSLTGSYTLAIAKNAQTGWNESVQTGVTLAADTAVNFTVTHALAGDASMDGKVDVSDLGILAANYGGTGKTWDLGDFNGDGKVDVSDLGILAAHYGQRSGGATQATDFQQDMKAIGFSVDSNTGESADTQKTQTEDNPVAKNLGGCGSAGLPLIAGIFLAGLLLIGLKMKE